MSHRFAIRPRAALPLALGLLAGAAAPARAQDTPEAVGISVAGTVVEVPVDLAAEACGVDAETLLADWAALGTEMATMADTSVAADATDLAPAVEVDTAMDAAIDGETPADGADATHTEGGGETAEVAPDTASDAAEMAGDAGPEPTDGPATPTEGTDLAKAAVCEVSQETADSLGIAAPG